MTPRRHLPRFADLRDRDLGRANAERVRFWRVLAICLALLLAIQTFWPA